ncbi:MAG: hypothetical protein ACPGWR_26520 [Ardenticatenaceae bacterium]
MKKDAYTLYQKYHLDRADERFGMFEILAENFNIERVLYPGSFVHVTPSFIFPKAVYVDTQKPAKQFFATPARQTLIAERKIYPQEAEVHFHHQDYTKVLPACDESFELLISQYGGFVSQYCKRYLKIGTWLVANNSHGDASMAFLDDDYRLAGVIDRRSDKFRFRMEKLDEYFIPKKDMLVTKEYLTKIGRGIGYQKSAFAYVFVRIQ